MVGALLAFLLGYLRDRQKENREREQLRDALYQEIANNYETLIYWTREERLDFDNLKARLPDEVTFLAYSAAEKSAGLFFSIPEHGYLIACYREMKKLVSRCPTAEDEALLKLWHQAAGLVDNFNAGVPRACKEKLISKLEPEYRKYIQLPPS